MLLGLIPNSPLELGFPQKFDKWRNLQPDSIEASLLSTKRITAQCAPTGFGKSQCYMAQAVLERGRTCILTGTKGLQSQLLGDYGSIGLVSISGKDNYPCSARPGWTCKDGHASNCPWKGSTQCAWSQAYNVARISKIVVTNYKLWIAIHRYGGGLGTFQTLVLDEAHMAPDEVATSMQVKLSDNEMNLLGTDFPKTLHPGGEEWKLWATKTRILAQKCAVQQLAKIQKSRDPKPTWIRDFHHFKNLVQKLAIVALMRHEDWVWEHSEIGWQLDPVRFSRYAESRLLLKVPKIVMYSATIRPKTINMLGFRNDEFLFLDWPAVFDPRRSPVYQVPTQKVDQKTQDLSTLVLRIDQILGPRLKDFRNGIIHVTSFNYRNDIVRGSHFRQYMVSNWELDKSIEAIKRFVLGGGVLISPAAAEGYDFPDDVCRFQILTKIPFRPRSTVTDARQAADPTYGAYNAMQKLVQSAGRGTRSDKDWCENFLLDDNAYWFMPRNKHLAPKAFWQRYASMSSIPPPLQI